MDYRALFEQHLMAGSYKKVAKDICNQPAEVEQVVKVILANENKYSFWNSWFLTHIFDCNKLAIVPHIKELYGIMGIAVQKGTVRSILRCFAMSDVKLIPESIEESLIDDCFKMLEDPKEEVAIRVYAMQMLCNYRFKHAFIKSTLTDIIDFQLETYDCSAACRSRARRAMKALSKV